MVGASDSGIGGDHGMDKGENGVTTQVRTSDGVIGNRAAERRRYYNPAEKTCATILETSEETGGRHTLIEVEVGPGGGTNPHVHRTYAEHFEVLRGELEVMVGGAIRTLHPGERAEVPKNTLHRFRNRTDGQTAFLVELRPGHAGFEKAMKVVYGLASDGLTRADGTPKNPYHLAMIMEWADIPMTGAFAIAGPLFRLLAWRARRKGIDQKLEARYC